MPQLATPELPGLAREWEFIIVGPLQRADHLNLCKSFFITCNLLRICYKFEKCATSILAGISTCLSHLVWCPPRPGFLSIYVCGQNVSILTSFRSTEKCISYRYPYAQRTKKRDGISRGVHAHDTCFVRLHDVKPFHTIIILHLSCKISSHRLPSWFLPVHDITINVWQKW